ncbi:acetyl-CoA synthetase-like protein [Dacryopinax primogenitus]|uniref:Acetyl-CoA synthetase-like protein n=1 Tax=Dacryopinax primogenitus (strain DJM 731) TaxID=1858805 RepID=M5GD04_DACPD|nr:acetyl-CoA synthetase-like protein [Dacryopinax primogenitus]EJU02073.1 acetyl-CoA synthetase-like protein [Dacryopinax primogenitus]
MDGSLPFPQLLDFHLEHNPNHSYAVLVGLGNDENVTITWAEVARASLRVAEMLRMVVKASDQLRKEGVWIAILANTDSYVTLILGILRAGFVAFPLSTRNSGPALEHLIKTTNTASIFGSIPGAASASTALEETTMELLSCIPSVQLLGIPKHTTLYPRFGTSLPMPYDAMEDDARTPRIPPVESLPEYKYVTEDCPLLFLHSSGSTSFPKPIPMSHRFFRAASKTTGDSDQIGTKWSLLGLPVFHAMGVFLMIGLCTYYGAICIMFKPTSQPPIASSDVVLRGCKRGEADFLITVPNYYVDWSHDEQAIKYLARMKGVAYGGGPLAQEAGDRLVRGGVNLMIVYGTVALSYEVGFRSSGRLEHMRVELVDEGSGLYRLIIIDSDHHPIAVSNVTGIRAFDTNDLLQQHPTRKHLWKVIPGRADDQIMMSNGEKTNPGPMEGILNGNPNIRACLMFGRERTQVGVAIDPVEHVSITNDAELAEFHDLIWPDIEKANAFAPQHSRIFKELVLVIDAKKTPFVKTPKGSINRNLTTQQLANQIDALYTAAEQPTKAEWAEPPASWDAASLESFVSRVVNGVMRGEAIAHPPIEESRDLFEQGCDSLQATYIRAAITNALRQAPKPQGKSDVAATSVPQNLVFNYPTVERLTGYMMKALGGVSSQSDKEEGEKSSEIVKNMQAMIDKYSRDFPTHTPGQRKALGEVVLLTGSTGTLGTYLLQSLLLDERVKRVYAVNRPSSKNEMAAGQREAFEDRGVDINLLKLPKLRLIETDTAAKHLGLSEELYDELCDSLTVIIHNAWRLDFNLPLSAFESNVRSSRMLVDLSLRTRGPQPAQLVFTSSIGTHIRWSEPRPVPEEPIDDPLVASASGYAQGKWVSERIMLAAAEKGLRAVIWRVGQLAGGKRLGVLPVLDGEVSWLPTERAAQTIADGMHDFALSEKGEYDYLHLVHPSPVRWETLLSPIADQLHCELVSFPIWLAKLEDQRKQILGGSRLAIPMMLFQKEYAILIVIIAAGFFVTACGTYLWDRRRNCIYRTCLFPILRFVIPLLIVCPDVLTDAQTRSTASPPDLVHPSRNRNRSTSAAHEPFALFLAPSPLPTSTPFSFLLPPSLRLDQHVPARMSPSHYQFHLLLFLSLPGSLLASAAHLRSHSRRHVYLLRDVVVNLYWVSTCGVPVSPGSAVPRAPQASNPIVETKKKLLALDWHLPLPDVLQCLSASSAAGLDQPLATRKLQCYGRRERTGP